MIERQFISQKVKEFQIKQFMKEELGKTGYSHIEIQRTPLGEKIVIYTTRPGIVVGKKGENINRLTAILKKRFKMENPQIEIGELMNPSLDASFMADKIASSFERFGSKRFKSIGYRTLQEIMDAGALGAEVIISGKVPSARARSWRFKAGYVKKSGDIAVSKIDKAFTPANLKAGTVGIKVSIMHPDIMLPDKITFKTIEVKKEEKPEEVEAPKEEKKVVKKKVKKTAKKKTEKKGAKDGNNKKE
jgi:small subunit ribosomal protein S3